MTNHFFCSFDWNSFWMNVLVSSIFLLISIKLIPLFTLKLLKKKRQPFILNKISILLLELCEFFEKSNFKTKEIYTEKIFIYSKNKNQQKKLIGLIGYNISDKNVIKKIDYLIRNSFRENSIEDDLKKLEIEYQKIVKLKNKLESFLTNHTLDIDTNYLIKISDICLNIRAFEIKFNRNYNSKDLFDRGLMKRYTIDGIEELRHSYKLIIDLTTLLLKNKNIEYFIEK